MSYLHFLTENTSLIPRWPGKLGFPEPWISGQKLGCMGRREMGSLRYETWEGSGLEILGGCCTSLWPCVFFFYKKTIIFISQTWTPLPPPTPYHHSGSSLCTSPKHPVSCIEHRLAIHFLHDSIHVSMPFSQIIPPSPSHSESKSPLYTSVSLLLSHIQGHRYHLSKFHIYALVYCAGVFLSGLLHSV